MKTALTIAIALILTATAYGDRKSYEQQLAQRRANRAVYSAMKRGSRGSRPLPAKSRDRLAQIANEQRYDPQATWRPPPRPSCQHTRRELSANLTAAATLAYYRHKKMRYQVKPSLQRLWDSANETGEPKQAVPPPTRRGLID